MGEAKVRELRKRQMEDDKRPVTFDLRRLQIELNESDRKQLSVNGTIHPLFNVGRMIIQEVVTRSFPNGMDRGNGRMWAGWQRTLSGTPESAEVTVTAGQIEWLRAKAADEKLLLPPQFAELREALCTLLDQVLASIEPEA